MLQKIKTKLFAKNTNHTFLKRSRGVLLFFIFSFFVFSVDISISQTPPSTLDTFLKLSQNPTIIFSIMPIAHASADDVFNFILAPLQSFFLWMISLAGVLLESVLDANLFEALMNSPGVESSWKAVRDSLNMFFILLLLFSAFATIFQVEKFHIKRVLLMVVIMALLVNFSFPISRFIIDVFNMPMYYLLDIGFSGNKTGTILDYAQVDKMFGELHWGDAAFEVYLISTIMAFIFMVTIFVLAILFTIRLISLIILVIFSPVGFVANIFPATKTFADSWWTALLKNAMFGPAMIFMLVISLRLLGDFQKTIAVEIAKQSTNNAMSGASSSEIGTFGALIYGAVPIVVLWMGMISANKFGIAGADVIVNKARGFAKGAPWKATKFIGRNLDQSLAKNTGYSFKSLKTSFQDYGKKKEEEAYSKSRGKTQDATTSFLDHASHFYNPVKLAKGIKGAFSKNGKFFHDIDRSDSEYSEMEKAAATKQKDIESESKKYSFVESNLENALERGVIKDAHASIRTMLSNNDLINEFMMSDYAVNNFKSDGSTDPTNARRVLKDVYAKAGASDKLTTKLMMGLDELATSMGNYTLTGSTDYDKEKKKFIVHDESASGIAAQASAARAKFLNQEPQARQRTIHPDSFFKWENRKVAAKNADGTDKLDAKGKVVMEVQRKITGFSTAGRSILEGMDGDDLEQANRTRGDVKTLMNEFVTEMQNGNSGLKDQFDDLGKTSKIAQVYINKLAAMKRGADKGTAAKSITNQIDSVKSESDYLSRPNA